MQKRAEILVLVLAAAGFVGGCVGEQIGGKCSSNGDCESKNCLRSHCTKVCTGQPDCPVGFDCGLAAPADSGPTCYARTYDQTAVEQGGFGADCSLYAPDPLDDTSLCSPIANPCAAGFFCRTSVKCDSRAYCTMACTVDTDCPASMFCATRVGPDCMGPSDCPIGRRNCVGGQCQGSMCLKREYCTPCQVDDQCGIGSVCAVTAAGERYCAKVCAGAENCARQSIDEMGVAHSLPSQLCTPDPTPRAAAVSVCAPAAGSCHGPSVVASISGADVACSPCRLGYPGDCGTGLACYQSTLTTERFCTLTCTITLQEDTSGNYGLVEGSDSCHDISPDLYCIFDPYVPDGCGSSCQTQGICGADPDHLGDSCYSCYDTGGVNQC